MADKQRWHPSAARGIIKRVIVEGTLTLESPVHLGNGDGEDLTDMPLLTDADGGPLLTGTSLAGALRAYLRQREHGWRADEGDKTKTFQSILLFGGRRGVDDGEQSPLIVEDAYGDVPEQDHTGMEVRHGNRIAPASRTAEHGALFDMDVWQAGTTFPLRLELLILAPEREGAANEAHLRDALATALAGLHPGDGGITLGARKQRGFGRVSAGDWRVQEYYPTDPDGLLAWIRHGGETLTAPPARQGSIADALSAKEIDDARALFTLEAHFLLTSDPDTLRAGSLLVRAGGGQDDKGPDMIHLHTRARNGGQQATLPGTSLAGALRARSRKILNTLCAHGGAPPARSLEIVDELFGPHLADRGKPYTGRLRVEEHALTNPRTDLVQSRNSIDRFTGGTRQSVLFNEQPAFAHAGGTGVTVKLQLADPQDYEVDLLLQLLKDLWTGDLPLGGETSVGRGRLLGQSATLTHQRPAPQGVQTWILNRTDKGGLTVEGARDGLTAWDGKLWEYLGGEA